MFATSGVASPASCGGEPRSDLWHADGRPAVIVADDLDPSAVATLRPELVAGIALAGGAPTGHVSIVARGLGHPVGARASGRTALSVPDAVEALVDGVDARSGRLVIDPDADDLAVLSATGPSRRSIAKRRSDGRERATSRSP